MSYKGRKRRFGRERDQRRELIRSLVRSLIIHKRIKTTIARAKAIRPVVEKLITKCKVDDLSTRRYVLSKMKNDNNVADILIKDVAVKYKDRDGGYTRIMKVEPRQGSGREVAIIEFV